MYVIINLDTKVKFWGSAWVVQQCENLINVKNAAICVIY